MNLTLKVIQTPTQIRWNKIRIFDLNLNEMTVLDAYNPLEIPSPLPLRLRRTPNILRVRDAVNEMLQSRLLEYVVETHVSQLTGDITTWYLRRQDVRTRDITMEYVIKNEGGVVMTRSIEPLSSFVW